MRAESLAAGVALSIVYLFAHAPEQELIKLENDWNQAEVKKDFAFLNRILADDLQLVASHASKLSE